MTFNARNPAFFPVVVGVALAGHCERPSPAGRPGNVGSSSVWLGLPGASPAPWDFPARRLPLGTRRAFSGPGRSFRHPTKNRLAAAFAPVASGLIIR